MKVIAAYLLAVLGGNTSPTADDVKNILESVGAEADEDKLEFLLAELKDKDITEVIAAGREKFASVVVQSQWELRLLQVVVQHLLKRQRRKRRKKRRKNLMM
nr:unnamed protein product [Digitaria exilis]